MMRRAVVICPGRGTYGKSELGYLARHHPAPARLAAFDDQRRATGQATLAALDGAERFSSSLHMRGDNAAALIFAAGLGDFAAIDRAQVEIVAVTGNSMGWYTALACAGAVAAGDGFCIANTMGTAMHRASIGGQLVYPVVGGDWRPDPERRARLLALVRDIATRPGQALYLSIDLGGMLVLAGDDAGLRAFERAVDPVDDRYPLRLAHHAAFHTPLMAPVAAEGRSALPVALFGDAVLPMIDGRGAIWWPGAYDPDRLRAYTLGTQVTETYDFTRAVTVAAREFAPDLFIIVGPGTTMGGAVIQSLIRANWRGMADRADFAALQVMAPLVVSMGRDDQRGLVAAA